MRKIWIFFKKIAVKFLVVFFFDLLFRILLTFSVYL